MICDLLTASLILGSGWTKCITKLLLKNSTSLSYLQKRIKTQTAKTSVGFSIHLTLLLLSLIVPLSEEKLELANSHAVCFRSNGLSNHTFFLT